MNRIILLVTQLAARRLQQLLTLGRGQYRERLERGLTRPFHGIQQSEQCLLDVVEYPFRLERGMNLGDDLEAGLALVVHAQSQRIVRPFLTTDSLERSRDELVVVDSGVAIVQQRAEQRHVAWQ